MFPTIYYTIICNRGDISYREIQFKGVWKKTDSLIVSQNKI